MTDTLESDIPIPLLLFGSMDSLYGIKQSIKLQTLDLCRNLYYMLHI